MRRYKRPHVASEMDASYAKYGLVRKKKLSRLSFLAFHDLCPFNEDGKCKYNLFKKRTKTCPIWENRRN